jgi:hypothetical protein
LETTAVLVTETASPSGPLIETVIVKVPTAV